MTVDLDRRHVLEQLGLSYYEACVLAALADIGSGNSTAIAAASGVGRTSVYAAAAELVNRGLIRKPASLGPTIWECDGWPQIADALRVWLTVQHERQVALVADLAGQP